MDKIEIIMLPVADQQKAKEFYLKLGFEIRLEAPGAHNDTWIQLGLPGQDTSISLAKFHAVICETADIETEVGLLKTKGIEIGKIDKTPWGSFAWMKDPDGNGVCLHQK